MIEAFDRNARVLSQHQEVFHLVFVKEDFYNICQFCVACIIPHRYWYRPNVWFMSPFNPIFHLLVLLVEILRMAVPQLVREKVSSEKRCELLRVFLPFGFREGENGPGDLFNQMLELLVSVWLVEANETREGGREALVVTHKSEVG
jgi:hypothetical protein